MSALTMVVKGGTVADNLENWAGKVTFSGLIIVFTMLILLVVLIWAFGRIMHGTTSESKKAVNNAASPAPAIPTAPFVSNDDIEGETIAAISAAVMMMYEGTGKIPVIRSIKRADRGFVNAWRAAGIANNTRSF